MKEEGKEATSSQMNNFEAIKEETPYFSEEDSFLYDETELDNYTTESNQNFKTEDDGLQSEEDPIVDETEFDNYTTESNQNFKTEDDGLQSEEDPIEDCLLDLKPSKNKTEDIDRNQPGERSHERNIRTRRSLTCELCSKKFRWAGNLRRHMLLCDGGGPYICNLCNQQVANKQNLQRHIEFMHMVEIQMYECPVCGKQCTRKGNLKAHIATHKKPKRDIHFACHKCGEEFPDRSNLMRHVRSHDGLECKECGMKFSKESLAMHMALHIKGSRRRKASQGSLEKCIREVTEEEVSNTTRKPRKKSKKEEKTSNLLKKMKTNNPLSAMWTAFNSQ